MTPRLLRPRPAASILLAGSEFHGSSRWDRAAFVSLRLAYFPQPNVPGVPPRGSASEQPSLSRATSVAVLPAPGACAASASGSRALSLWREPSVRAEPRCSADRSFQPPALSELSNAGGVFRLVLDGSSAAAQRTPPPPPPAPLGRGRPRVFSRGLGVPPGTFVAASQPGRARCCKPHARSWISLVPPRALLCSRTPSGASLSFSRHGFVGLFGL